jgi:hypothetical protein
MRSEKEVRVKIEELKERIPGMNRQYARNIAFGYIRALEWMLGEEDEL